MNTTVEDFEFVISRTFPVTRERMFALWTEAGHLQHWFGPAGCTISYCENDYRVGGLMRYGLSWDQSHDLHGRWVYREIVPPERLVFVVSFTDADGKVIRHPLDDDWPLHILSTVEFEAAGEQTKVTVRWRAVDATAVEQRAFSDGRDSMRQGWTGTFERLETYLSDRGA
jgi:uncharacterized protein YndB with AHSA1/START domain